MAVAFLDKVLDGDYTSGELKGLWNRHSTDIYFRHGDGVRQLMTLIRQILRSA